MKEEGSLRTGSGRSYDGPYVSGWERLIARLLSKLFVMANAIADPAKALPKA